MSGCVDCRYGQYEESPSEDDEQEESHDSDHECDEERDSDFLADWVIRIWNYSLVDTRTNYILHLRARVFSSDLKINKMKLLSY